ncbi:hypothetical protein [Pirellulimonas nuda]|nr:hypothetical protein [Pirellulimonas nuda]
MPGCKGCEPETPQAKAARELKDAEEQERERIARLQREKAAEPFEIAAPVPLPNETDLALLLVKPGHWTAVSQKMESKLEDWVGESTQELLDKQDRPIAVPRTAFSIRSTRPVALPKQQVKQIDTVLFPAPSDEPTRIISRLSDRGGGVRRTDGPLPLSPMLAHQYNLVVLAKEPARYTFLKSLYAVNAPFSGFEPESLIGSTLPFPRQYRVVTPKLDGQPPIPDAPLCWTSIAYVVWDEVDPDTLSPQQRTALVDWLHWGGQLVISGPDSLGLLRQSFLDPYLPAEGDGAVSMTARTLGPLSDAFLVGRRQAAALRPTTPWSGVKLTRRPGAAAVPGCGDLVIERPVGRGRVVVTAFQLAERDLLNWSGGAENFFNAALLRRPGRKFLSREKYSVGSDSGVVVEWLAGEPTRVSAADNTRVRYFVRDTHADGDAAVTFKPQVVAGGGRFNAFPGFEEQPIEELTPPTFSGGYGAWNDFSAASSAAREALREAAGVNVPGRGFVLACLGIYLLLIGPVNWAFFQTLGRVELAWIAAPILAVLATWVVVRQAQLDIGFVRAQTEVAILEAQPDYPRGCLTRYTALYTSLATTYQMEFEDGSAVAAPFAARDDFTLLPGESLSPVEFSRQERVRLRNLFVSSASTGMAHSEQMIDLGGAVSLTKSSAGLPQITNRTQHTLSSLALVERQDGQKDAPLRGCWIGELLPGQSAAVSMQPVLSADGAPFLKERAAEDAQAERLNLEPLFELALSRELLEPGSARAVARINRAIDGLTVTPQASQQQGATLLVAHLRHAPPPAPEGDANAPSDIAKETRQPSESRDMYDPNQ